MVAIYFIISIQCTGFYKNVDLGISGFTWQWLPEDEKNWLPISMATDFKKSVTIILKNPLSPHNRLGTYYYYLITMYEQCYYCIINQLLCTCTCG